MPFDWTSCLLLLLLLLLTFCCWIRVCVLSSNNRFTRQVSILMWHCNCLHLNWIWIFDHQFEQTDSRRLLYRHRHFGFVAHGAFVETIKMVRLVIGWKKRKSTKHQMLRPATESSEANTHFSLCVCVCVWRRNCYFLLSNRMVKISLQTIQLWALPSNRSQFLFSSIQSTSLENSDHKLELKFRIEFHPKADFSKFIKTIVKHSLRKLRCFFFIKHCTRYDTFVLLFYSNWETREKIRKRNLKNLLFH